MWGCQWTGSRSFYIFVRFDVRNSHMCTLYQSSVFFISRYLSFPNLGFDSRMALNELWAGSHDSHSPNSSESDLLSLSTTPPWLQDQVPYVSSVIYMSVAETPANSCRNGQTGLPRRRHTPLWAVTVCVCVCGTFAAASTAERCKSQGQVQKLQNVPSVLSKGMFY